MVTQSNQRFMIPATFALSLAAFAVPGAAYIFHLESNVLLKIARLEGELDKDRRTDELRRQIQQNKENEMIRKLNEIREAQSQIRKTQAEIRATQAEIRQDQQVIKNLLGGG